MFTYIPNDEMRYVTSTTVDRLKICYTVTQTGYAEFTKVESEVDYGSFKLAPIKPVPPHTHSYSVKMRDGDTWPNYAQISIGNKLDSDDVKKLENQFVWLEFTNRTLYSPVCDGSSVSKASLYQAVTDTLGMTINNVTRLEIAFDSTWNMANRIKRAVMNKDYVPLINGRACRDLEAIIPDIKYVRTGNRMRYKTLSVYVHPKYDKKIILRAYNKSEEIQSSQKHYVREFTGMPETFYRLEVAAQSEAIKELLNLKRMTVKEFIDWILTDEVFRLSSFQYFASRLIRFNTPQGRKSVLQI